jgi:hypothetical protein
MHGPSAAHSATGLKILSFYDIYAALPGLLGIRSFPKVEMRIYPTFYDQHGNRRQRLFEYQAVLKVGEKILGRYSRLL